MAEAVTVERIKATARMVTSMHGRLSRGGYLYLYQSETWPQFVLKVHRETRQKPETRTYYVGELECPDLQAVADALTALQEKPVQKCRVCGCTWSKACSDPETGLGCHWVETDLCSACKAKAVAA